MKALSILTLIVAMALPAFAADDKTKPTDTEVSKAVAVLHSTKGNKVAGTVTFTKEGKGVRVVAHVTGLQANSEHGFHVHEFGDVSSEDGTATGGHFNPDGHQHGGPEAEEKHAGDLGNLKANGQGVAHLDLVAEHLALDGENSVIGRGLIVHAKADDLKSQPTGDAGDRIAQAVIGAAKK